MTLGIRPQTIMAASRANTNAIQLQAIITIKNKLILANTVKIEILETKIGLTDA